MHDCNFYFNLNTVPEKYASAKEAFLHPLKLHVPKNLNMQYDRLLL